MASSDSFTDRSPSFACVLECAAAAALSECGRRWWCGGPRRGDELLPKRRSSGALQNAVASSMRRLLRCGALLLVMAMPAFAQEASLPPPVRIESGVSGHIHPALCLTHKGTLVAAFCKSETKPYLITRSTDGGKTWSTPALFPPTTDTPLYPGSLTTLSDGRLLHAWNVWFAPEEKAKSRYVAFSTSSDDGVTWSEPKALKKNADPKIH